MIIALSSIIEAEEKESIYLGDITSDMLDLTNYDRKNLKGYLLVLTFDTELGEK